MHRSEIIGPPIVFVACALVGWYLNAWAEIGASGSGLRQGLVSGGFKFALVVSVLTLVIALARRRTAWATFASFLPLVGGIGSWVVLPFLGH